jgi:hypothetical protein
MSEWPMWSAGACSRFCSGSLPPSPARDGVIPRSAPLTSGKNIAVFEKLRDALGAQPATAGTVGRHQRQ